MLFILNEAFNQFMSHKPSVPVSNVFVVAVPLGTWSKSQMFHVSHGVKFITRRKQKLILLLQLQDESDIVIAKMDATANDVPKIYEVSG